MQLDDVKIHGNLIGHQGRCFDLRLQPDDSNRLLSASEDGNAKLWNIGKRSCIHTFVHNKECEVLRSAFVSSDKVCTAGSDGKVMIWDSRTDILQSTTPSASLVHSNESSQIYVCEPLSSSTDSVGVQGSHIMLTAADSEVYLWDIGTQQTNSIWQFTSASNQIEGFGGDSRNPNRDVYIFDAKWRPNAIHEAVVALSDSTLRILDVRHKNPAMTLSLEIEELAVAGLHLGHATSVNWNVTGSICSVSFGSGIVALIDIAAGECVSLTRVHNAPCYGTIFHGKGGGCISWSADSTIRSWCVVKDASNNEDITIQKGMRIKDLSVLSCCVQPSTGSILCGGGNLKSGGRGSQTLFLGTPIHIIAETSFQNL